MNGRGGKIDSDIDKVFRGGGQDECANMLLLTRRGDVVVIVPCFFSCWLALFLYLAIARIKSGQTTDLPFNPFSD
jgi:hypothetical protein